MYEFRRCNGNSELEKVQALRQAVKLDSEDPRDSDPANFLIIMLEDETLIGSVRIDFQPDGKTAILRKFAVDPARHRQGFGRKLNDYAEAIIRSQGFQLMGLEATIPSVIIYDRLGYIPGPWRPTGEPTSANTVDMSHLQN